MPNAFDEFDAAAPARPNAFDAFDRPNAFDEFTAPSAPPASGPGWTGDKVRRVGEGAAESTISIPQGFANAAAGIIEDFSGLPQRIERAPLTYKTRHAYAAQQSIPDEEWERMINQREGQRAAARPAIVDNMRADVAALGALKQDQREVYAPNPKYDGTLGAQIAAGVGSSLPTLIGAAATGGAGVLPTVGLQLYQEAFDEAIGQGRTTEQAHVAGLGSIPLAYLEKFGDVRIGKALRDSLDAAGKQAVRQSMGKVAGRAAGNVAQGMVGEGVTETLQDAGQQANIYNGNVDWQRSLRAGLVGALSGGVLSAPGAIVDVAANARRATVKPNLKVLPAPADFSEFGGEAATAGPEQTFPEAPATLAAQMDRFRTGERRAVLFTPGTAEPIPAEGETVTATEIGKWLHRPGELSAEGVRQAVAENRTGELLGYGVAAKPAAEAGAFALTQRDAQGTPVNDVVATPATAPLVQAALQQQSRPGDTIEERPAEAAIAERAAAFGQALDQRDQSAADWSAFAQPAEGPPVESNVAAAQRMAAENEQAMRGLREAKAKTVSESVGERVSENPPADPLTHSPTHRLLPVEVTEAEIRANVDTSAARAPDLLDAVKEFYPSGIQFASRSDHGEAVKQFRAAAGKLKALVSHTTGEPADTALKGLHLQGQFQNITTEGELLAALREAAHQRQQAAPQARTEALELAREQKRQALWERAALAPRAQSEAVPVETLYVGDELNFGGHTMRVTEWVLDAETGQPSGVQLDGAYGRQTVPVGQSVYPAAESASRPSQTLDARLKQLANGLRKRSGKTNLNFFAGLDREIVALALDAVRLALRGGRTIGAAVQAGIDFVRQNHPGVAFDEAAFRDFLGRAVNPGEEPEKPRQYGQKILGNEQVSPDVQSRVTEYSYTPRTNETDEATARRILAEQGVATAIATYHARPADLPGAVHSMLGDAITEQLSQDLAAAVGNPTQQAALVETQAAFLDQQLRDATTAAQTLQAMRRLGLASPAALVKLARKTITRAGQDALERVRPAVQATQNELDAGTADAATAVTRDAAANTAARQAVNAAVEQSAETHRAVVMEVSEEWSQSPVIVNELKRQLKGKFNALMQAQPAPASELKKRFGAMLDDALNRAISIANAHYQGVDALPSGAPLRTLAEKLQERLGLSKPESQKLAATLDKEFARLVDVKKKGLSKRLAAQRARQLAGIAGGEANPVDAAIRAQLRAMNLKLGQALQQPGTGAEIAERIVQELKLTGPEAEAVRRVIEARFNQLATEAKRKRLEALGRDVSGAKKIKGAFEKIIEAHNAGGFSEEKLYDLVREKLKLPRWTPAFAAEINRLAGVVPKKPEGFQRQRAIIELLNAVGKHEGMKWYDGPLAVWYANILSGPLTHAKNLLGNIYNLGSFAGLQLLRDPAATFQIMGALGRGAVKGGLEGAEILRSGIVTGTKLAKFEASRPIEHMHKALLPWKMVGRLLNAEDMLFFKAAEEMRSATAARLVAKKEGLTGKARDQRVRDILGNVEARQTAAEVQARSEGLRGLDLRRRVNEILEQSRPAPLRETARDYALRATFNQQPEGVLGILTQHWAGAAAHLPALRLLVPFTNVIANVVNESLFYFPPTGAYRAVRAQWGSKSGEMMGRPVQAGEVFDATAKAILGTAGLVGLAAFALKYQDDDDPYFALTGGGPRSSANRKQLQQTGWRPYTVKIGGRYVNYQQTPGAVPLAILGNFLDSIKYKKLDEADALTRLAVALHYSGRVITEQSWLDGLARFFGLLARDAGESAADEGGRQLARTAASFVVPNAIHQVDQLFDPTQYKADDVESLLLSQVPFVRRLNKPDLNALGEPVTMTRGSKFISPEEIDPVWRVLTAKQAWITTPDRDVIVGDKSRGPDHYRVLDADEYYDYVAASGAAIRRRLENALPRIENMEPPAAKAYVQKLVEQERTRARRRFPR